MNRPRFYTRVDLKTVADRGALQQHVSYSRHVTLACGHGRYVTGKRALEPPRRMYCFECRCARVNAARPAPAPGLAAAADEAGAAMLRERGARIPLV
jgi:hypothetical protein